MCYFESNVFCKWRIFIMSGIIISNILILGGTALLAAVVLYFIAQKFKVEENPKIEQIEALLPGANCGACGKAGCHAFAVACAFGNAPATTVSAP